MKRCRAILLFGTLLAVMAGYVTWCSRSFWLKVPLPDVGVIPEEGRVSILRELEESGLRKPREFNFWLCWHFLTHPYDSARETIGLNYRDGTQPTLSATRSMKQSPRFFCGTGYRIPMVLFVRENGRWHRLPELEEGSY